MPIRLLLVMDDTVRVMERTTQCWSFERQTKSQIDSGIQINGE